MFKAPFGFGEERKVYLRHARLLAHAELHNSAVSVNLITCVLMLHCSIDSYGANSAFRDVSVLRTLKIYICASCIVDAWETLRPFVVDCNFVGLSTKTPAFFVLRPEL